jgi:integrase
MKTASKNPKVICYARHNSDCRWKDTETKLSCDCPKWLRWHRNGKPFRKSADTRDGDRAMQLALEMTASFEAAANGTVIPEKSTGKLLEDAVKVFLDTKRNDSVTDKHVEKYRFELNEFSSFMQSLGRMNLGDVTPENVLAWRNAMSGAQSTKRKKVHRLKGFFTLCCDMGMIVKNPAAGKHLFFKETEKQTPKALSDEQFAKVLSCVPKLNGRGTPEERQMFRSLVILMRHSGLAIRDALFIERAQIQPAVDGFCKLFLYRAKTGNAVSGSLPEAIAAEIFRGARADGRYLFVDAVPDGEKERDTLAKKWGVIFSKLSDMAALVDEHGQAFEFGSHSMRHTFVRSCYDMGMSSDDIAALIGDSVKVLLDCYSGWVHSRQQKLTERFQAALTAAAGK